MNLFLAFHIEPDKQLRDVYYRLKKLYRGQRVKFYPLEEMFLILRYLPETEPEFLSDVNRIIGSVTSKYSPVTINIEGVDIYPYKVLPKVLWFRVTEDKTIRALAEELDEKLREFGYSPEDFAFYPHITFARIRKLDDTKVLDKTESEFSSFQPIGFPASEVVMFESIRTTGHTRYRVRNRFKLSQ